MPGFVYILSNSTHTAIYVGVTNNLLRRVDEHRRHVYPKSFTAKYQITRLVYFESFEDVRTAISREKQLKSWSRRKKNELIDDFNPKWRDLFPDVVESEVVESDIFPDYTG